MDMPTDEQLQHTEFLEALMQGGEVARTELLQILRNIAEQRAELDEAELTAVSILRPYTSWQTIADSLGINKTTAMRRFAELGY